MVKHQCVRLKVTADAVAVCHQTLLHSMSTDVCGMHDDSVGVPSRPCTDLMTWAKQQQQQYHHHTVHTTTSPPSTL